MLPILLSFLEPSSIHQRLTHCSTFTQLLNPLVLSRHWAWFSRILAHKKLLLLLLLLSSGIWPALLCSPEHLLVFVLRNGINIVRPYYLCIQHIYGNSKYLSYTQPIVNILFTNLTWKCPVNLPHQSHHCSVWLCQTQSQRASTCSLQPSVLGRHYDASRHCQGRASQEVVVHPAVQCICDQVYYDITIL